MTERESVYLDLVRALAALNVAYGHAPQEFSLPHIFLWGHQAVMVFFVLSGYLIAIAADKPAITARSFVVARLARLWSVLVPALLLTVVLDLLGRHLAPNPAAYAHVPSDWPLIRIGAAATFLSESWVSILPLSNGVTWSLCAEFWYYMLFAAFVFLQPGRFRTAILVGILLVGGFKALLLLPIWLAGVALHRCQALRRLSHAPNVALFLVSGTVIAAVLATQWYDVPIAWMQDVTPPWIYRQLAQCRVFWFDWVFGGLVSLHLLGARSALRRVPLERVAAPVRWCAGISFALYLLHAPIEYALAAFLPGLNGWVAFALTLLAIAAVGHPIERSKRAWVLALDTGIDAAAAWGPGVWARFRTVPPTASLRRS